MQSLEMMGVNEGSEWGKEIETDLRFTYCSLPVTTTTRGIHLFNQSQSKYLLGQFTVSRDVRSSESTYNRPLDCEISYK